MDCCKRIKTSNLNTLMMWITVLSMAHVILSEEILIINAEVHSLSSNYSDVFCLNETDILRLSSVLCSNSVMSLKIVNYTGDILVTPTPFQSNETSNIFIYSCGVDSHNIICAKETQDKCSSTKNLYWQTLKLTSCDQTYIEMCSLDNNKILWNYSSDSLTNKTVVFNKDATNSGVLLSMTSLSPNYKHGDDNEGFLPIIIGCCVGGTVLIIVIVIVIVVIVKKKDKGNERNYHQSKSETPTNLEEHDVATKQINFKIQQSLSLSITENTNFTPVRKVSNSQRNSTCDMFYSEIRSQNKNTEEGNKVKNMNLPQDILYDSVDQMEVAKTTQNKKLKIGQSVNKPYVEMSIPDPTPTEYSLLRESAKEFHNVYNVSPTQDTDRNQETILQQNTSSKHATIHNIDNKYANPTKSTPSYENVLDDEKCKDVYAQVNKHGKSNKPQKKLTMAFDDLNEV